VFYKENFWIVRHTVMQQVCPACPHYNHVFRMKVHVATVCLLCHDQTGRMEGKIEVGVDQLATATM
jgi:transposase-like protein